MRKHFTASFKAQVVQELFKEDKTIAQIAAEYEVHPTQLNKGKSTALSGLPGLFEEKDSLAALKASHEEQLNKLYAEIGRLPNPCCRLFSTGGSESSCSAIVRTKNQ